MDLITKISETVYVGMCRIVGTPTQVSIRREVVDIAEIIMKPVEMKRRARAMLSGSRREGFGPIASDVDYMRWKTDHHVIYDLNHADKYKAERCTLILMECSKVHPGFAMLQLLTPTNIPSVRQACIRIKDGLYISSAIYRENTLPLFKQDSTQHGPCASGRAADMEYDLAHCLVCKQWPSIASSFTVRCRSKRRPPIRVLNDIINSGCHVIPIGFKGSPEEDCEWRISFSVAEQNLIHCMNHTQFMCYGLLKVFLKEVLIVEDTDGQPLLCSYFMKTVLFWVIQNNTVIDWNPSSLLSGFWLCFKFLLSCVHHAYLPNFFIPENNIFISKIFGQLRQLLYEQLFEMYNLGIACLLHCHSIRNWLAPAICSRHYVISTAEPDIIYDLRLNYELFHEIEIFDFFYIFGLPCSKAMYCFTILHSAARYLHTTKLNPRQRVALRKFISSNIRSTVYQLYNTINKTNNKNRVRTMRALLNMSRISTELGFFSDKIYLALLLFSIGKNTDAIKYLRRVLSIITLPYIMYTYYPTVDEEKYNKEVEGMSLSERMRRVVSSNIRLHKIMIRELELEFRATTEYMIFVPPYVMTLMLLVSCYRGNPQQQQIALDELYVLLHYDKGRYIPTFTRDISWQILGICQQICRDHQGAFLSYQNSLKEKPFHNIQMATYCRIHDVQCRFLLSRGNIN